MSIRDRYGAEFLPRARKTRAVLAILTLAAPRPVLRANLTALLWSQREKDQARASLRQSVHELRDMPGTPWSRLLTAERYHLSLDPADVAIDVLDATRPGAPRAELLSLLRHGFLEDLAGLDPSFDDWLTRERRRLVSTARAAGETILREQQGQDDRIGVARALLRIDNTHEAAWQALIQAYLDAGDQEAALFACEQWREAIGLTPDQPMPPELAAARQRLQPAGAASGNKSETPRPGGERRRSALRLGIREPRVIGGGANQALSTGLTDEVTTAMSRIRWISCVATVDASPDLDFILEGTIQQSGDRVRIMVRLLDQRLGGEVVWARRFDRDATDTLKIQDEVGAAIVAQLDPELLMREGERAAARLTPTAVPRDLVLRAVLAIYRLDRSAFHAAGGLLEKALLADPGYGVAHAWYAYWHLFLVGQGWADDPDAATRRAGELADAAVALDPNDARAQTLAGHVRAFLTRRPAEAVVLHDRAIALNPNLALAWCFSGLTQTYLGNHALGLERIIQAARLSPSDPHLFFFETAMVIPLLYLGDYEAAAAAGRRAIELNPWFSSAFKVHICALGHLGRVQEAAAVLPRLLALEPGFNVRDAVRRAPVTLPADLEHYAEGLRLAGLPET